MQSLVKEVSHHRYTCSASVSVVQIFQYLSTPNTGITQRKNLDCDMIKTLSRLILWKKTFVLSAYILQPPEEINFKNCTYTWPDKCSWYISGIGPVRTLFVTCTVSTWRKNKHPRQRSSRKEHFLLCHKGTPISQDRWKTHLRSETRNFFNFLNKERKCNLESQRLVGSYIWNNATYVGYFLGNTVACVKDILSCLKLWTQRFKECWLFVHSCTDKIIRVRLLESPKKIA